MSTSPKPVKPSAPPPPKWWAPSAGIWFAVGFLVLAGVPYLVSTTKLMAAGKEASLEKITAEVKKKKEEPDKQREIKGLASAPDGTLYGGGKAGLFSLKNGQWTALEGFTGHEVKALAVNQSGALFVAHHDGVSKLQNGAWSEVYEGNVHNLIVTADDSVLMSTVKPSALMKLEADGSWRTLNDGLPVAQ
jgi:hypothetical protein